MVEHFSKRFYGRNRPLVEMVVGFLPIFSCGFCQLRLLADNRVNGFGETGR
jgi:hypothetical protein